MSGEPHPDTFEDGRPLPEKCLVVCGPTASGKSALTDRIAAAAGERGVPSRTVLVDSMQVYRGIPTVTNQHRERPASLSSIVCVTEEWSVAAHKEKVYQELRQARALGERPILEAGTGMYLNAVLLDLPMFARVPPELREEAERAVATGPPEPNPRRAARREELRLAGERRYGEASVWSGEPPFLSTLVYLRPDRERLDRQVDERSRRLCSLGLAEVQSLLEEPYSGRVSKTVLESIGVRELLAVARGEATLHEAERAVSARTRKLVRKQLRWFDKLARNLEGRNNVRAVEVLDRPGGELTDHTLLQLHDTIGWWMD